LVNDGIDGEQRPSRCAAHDSRIGVIENAVLSIQDSLLRFEAILEIQRGRDDAHDKRLERLTDVALAQIADASAHASRTVVDASRQAGSSMARRIVIPVGAITAVVGLLEWILKHYVG
jgi:hypothetical protein